VLGAQFGNNASAGLLYPTAFRSKGVGWALGVGRFGAIAGQLAGGALLAMHLPVRSLFLMASLPMVVGTVAAALLIPVCYARLGTLTLDDAPAAPSSGPARGTLAGTTEVRAPQR
jgi:AAHS family 4-hydroxybenzoate transporter-like MFS transporter